jgi:hypothetical protein
MAHYLTSDGKYRGIPCRINRGRGRAASNHVNRYLRKVVEAIAAAKLHRLRRETERCAGGGRGK